MALYAVANEFLRLGEPTAMCFCDGHECNIGLFLEVNDMPLADQAKADETDADALRGAGDSAIGRRGESRRALHEVTPVNGTRMRGSVHLLHTPLSFVRLTRITLLAK